MDTLASIRAQRAEVEALLAWRHAAEGEAKCLAWWRLQQCRAARLTLLSDVERASLAPLPQPPKGTLGRLQSLRLRFGLLTLERINPPSPIARRLRR